MRRWLHPGVALTVFLVSLFQLCSFDIFWHLRIGEILWSTGHILDCNRFSWTSPQQAWTPTYWLFEALVYPVFVLAGAAGLVVVKATILAIAWGSLAGFCERRMAPAGEPGPRWLLLLVCVAAVDVGLFRFMFRPHIFSFLGLALLIQVLGSLRAEPRRRAAWWQVPLLFGLWTNLHSGVVFGFCYFGIFVADEAVAALRRRGLALCRRATWSQEPLLSRACALLALAVPASLLNPTGAGLFTYVFDHLTMDQVIALEELAPLSLRLHPKACFVTAWFVLLPVLFLLASRRLRLETLLRAGFCGFLLTKGVRFIPKACLMCLPSVVEAVAAWRVRQPDSPFFRPAASPGRQRLHAWGLYLVVPLLYAWHVHAHVYTLEESCFRFGFTANPESYPIAVCNAMPPRLDRGLYNSFSVGGYVIWRFQERVKVFQDGRIHAYPADLFRRIEPLRVSTAGCARLLEEFGISHVLVSLREDPVMAVHVSRDPAWQVVSRDSHFLYARRR